MPARTTLNVDSTTLISMLNMEKVARAALATGSADSLASCSAKGMLRRE